MILNDEEIAPGRLYTVRDAAHFQQVLSLRALDCYAFKAISWGHRAMSRRHRSVVFPAVCAYSFFGGPTQS